MKNWRTSLIGFLAGVFHVVNAPFDWHAWVAGGLTVLLGYVAKDASVTGIGVAAKTLGE